MSDGPTDADVERHPARVFDEASAGSSGGADRPPADSGSTDSDAGDVTGESPSDVAGAAPRFHPCQLCRGSGSVVVADLTAEIRVQTGQPFTVIRLCPSCNGSGGLVVVDG